ESISFSTSLYLACKSLIDGSHSVFGKAPTKLAGALVLQEIFVLMHGNEWNSPRTKQSFTGRIR
ncbi:MAG: hypothetical protein ACPHJ3_21020, partial [Rubripirellula sp.]